MSILQSVLLGLVQGLCEFLPVSSSGHLILARLLFGIQTDSPALKMLDILLHVGTLIPVIVIFWHDWIDMLLHPIRNKSLVLLFIASLPTLAVYILAKKIFPEADGFAVFDSGWFLGVSFLITALFLLLCDAAGKKTAGRKNQITFFPAIIMGFFQGIGMIPGISRSGSTITGGVLSGARKETAAKFSFMMSAPAILGSFLMEGKDALEAGYLSEIDLFPALMGILVACLSGFLAIRFMLKIISAAPLGFFSLYLALIGVAYLLLQLMGVSGIPSFQPPVPAMG